MESLGSALSDGATMVTGLKAIVTTLGVFGLIFILIIALIFFIPSIVSVMRNIKLRNVVCLVNLVLILTFFIQIWIPVIIWLILMIIAFTAKPVPKVDLEAPTINIINNYSNDKADKKKGRK